MATFEKSIYENPEANFDKLYAKALNQYYRFSEQKTNPLYVLWSSLILRPGNLFAMSTISAEINYAHLSKKMADQKIY
ncbi:hypothetical protein HY045_03070 [Candidatus Woesebacteria bacterium]|nr:hypothetical protein [Candidatus Woesebacteria bacterium]